jgi:hypothetical protein
MNKITFIVGELVHARGDVIGIVLRVYNDNEMGYEWVDVYWGEGILWHIGKKRMFLSIEDSKYLRHLSND